MKKFEKQYIRNNYWKILLFFIFFVLLIVIYLKIGGTGFRTRAAGDSAPLNWVEMWLQYKKIIIFSLIITGIFTYYDFLIYRRKNKGDNQGLGI